MCRKGGNHPKTGPLHRVRVPDTLIAPAGGGELAGAFMSTGENVPEFRMKML